jgi:hypothetical protein
MGGFHRFSNAMWPCLLAALTAGLYTISPKVEIALILVCIGGILFLPAAGWVTL